MVSAQAQGVRVEDVSQRTESTQTFANPDGTWSTEMATGPVRVQRENGSWVDIDTTLEQNAAGEWAPRATAAEVAFSDGGTEPFATMEPAEGSSFGLTWPDALPQPVVSGSTLTYRNVVPNGDLVVQALPGGFSHEIVLHQAPAGPVDYQIPLELDGLELVEQANGTISVQTTAGKEVASAPEPLMWDHEDGPAGEPENVAPMDTTVDGTGANAQMVLTPDTQMLQDPATQYPVTLDPTFSKTPFRDTWVQNADYTSSQVGSPELRAGTYDGGGHKARSFVDFDTDTLNGKHILSATLKARNYYSGSCANGAIRANAISESWNKDTLTWANQPDVYPGNYDDYANAYGYTGCPDAGWAQWNVINMVQRWTNGTWVNRGVRLKAVDETSNATWRKYRSANYTTTTSFRPHLEVTYNSRPNVPTAPAVDPATSGYSTTTTPRLTTRVKDADGGSVRAKFQVRDAAGSLVWEGFSKFVPNDTQASVVIPSGKLASGNRYTIVALGHDGTDYSPETSLASSITIDTTGPASPVVASADYPADNTWNGDIARTGTFTVTPSSPDTASTTVWFDNEARTTYNGSSGASVQWTPQTTGEHVLYAQTIDQAGNYSDIEEYRFLVGDLTRPASPALLDQVLSHHFSAIIAPPNDEGDGEYDLTQPPIDETDDTPPGYVEDLDPVQPEQDPATAPVEESLVLPATSDGVMVGETDSGQLQLDLPGGTATPVQMTGYGDLLYTNVLPGIDTVAQRSSTDMVETFHLIRHPDAAKSFDYPVQLLADQRLVEGENNTAAVVDTADQLVALMAAPTAVDANGTPIPVDLSVSGSTVTVALAPEAGTPVAYPVLVDPTVYIPGMGEIHMTWAEARFCGRPWHVDECYHGFKQAQVALRSAQRWYPDNTLYLKIGDAFRHCLWNARMVVKIGRHDAYELATRHESDDSGLSKEMDLRNNLIGRSLGSKAATYDHPYKMAYNRCRGNAELGNLWIVRNGTNLVRGK